MHYGFTTELRRLIGFGVLGLIVGLVIGHPLASLLVCSLIYIGWTLGHLYRLDHWLRRRKKTPIPDAAGIWGDIFYNLSYREKRAHRRRQRLKSIVDRIEATTSALNDGVVLLDNRDCIHWWNPAAGRLLAFKAIDKGNSILNYIRHPKFALYLNASDRDLPLDLASHRLPARQLQYQVTRFGEGEGLLIVRDITRIHKLEQMRKDFVANVSHELRTPLTVICGYLETFKEVDNIEPVWKKAIVQMSQQANHMTELVNDLTTLSKLETDIEDAQKPLALVPLLTEVMAIADSFSNGSHQFSLDVAKNIWMIGNEKELHSAFSNLLFNAVRYSPVTRTGARKFITVAVTLDPTNRLHISFTDNGLGIEPQHLPRLTERFYRVDSSRDAHTGGTGLGLAIVKHVLLRHEAILEITSAPGQGSTFDCIFPGHKLIDGGRMPVKRSIAL